MSTPPRNPATMERKERLAVLVGLGLSDLRRLRDLPPAARCAAVQLR